MSGPAIDAERLTDVEALLGREGRDTLLRLAIESARAGAAAIGAATAAGDTATVRREAHALRGAVAGVGATELADLLARIEHGGGGLDALDAAVARLVVAAEAVLAGA